MNAPTKALSILDVYATQRSMEKQALVATMMNSVMPRDKAGNPLASMEDLVGFIQLAHRFDLDPWAKEIYCIMAKGKVQPYVSIDGYAKIVNRQDAYDGVEFAYEQDDEGNFVAVTCSMYRKDRTRPTVVTEFMAECRRDTDAWRGSPARMLRHRAFVQAARLCFGISGALDSDSHDIPMIDAVPVELERESQEAPRAPRKPPSPGAGRPADERTGSGPSTARSDPETASTATAATGNGTPSTKADRAEEMSDPNTGEVFSPQAFIDEINAALSTAKTLDEIETIWADHDVHVRIGESDKWSDRAKAMLQLHIERVEKKGKGK